MLTINWHTVDLNDKMMSYTFVPGPRLLRRFISLLLANVTHHFPNDTMILQINALPSGKLSDSVRCENVNAGIKPLGSMWKSMRQKIAGDHTKFNRPPQLHGLKAERADPLEMCAAYQVGSTNSLKTNSFHFPPRTFSSINVCVSSLSMHCFQMFMSATFFRKACVKKNTDLGIRISTWQQFTGKKKKKKKREQIICRRLSTEGQMCCFPEIFFFFCHNESPKVQDEKDGSKCVKMRTIKK